MTMMMMLITMMIMIMMMTLLMTMITIIGTLRNCDGDGKENINKAMGLMSKTTTLHVHHAFLYISLLSLLNYDLR